ncbi:hypothetical protein C8N46_10720 [Kordia periserrulae]|uniref:Uncharacterized protein n=1 Tax=Kordia periserrulae TaxID=701523 RepID=A0A2T6BVB1_9FLAO|nr:hypothetical protein [Kordia periserrulae]PTX60014.1 hypothetical protein C8N46_10720 [Kordia periserrulae]
MLKKISALQSVRALSKKEQHAINGGAGYLCSSTIMPGLYHSEEDISGDYGNGHVITCHAAERKATSGGSQAAS